MPNKKLNFFSSHKKLSISLIVIGAIIISLTIFTLVWSMSLRSGLVTDRNYVTYMKGVWDPLPIFLNPAAEIQQMKSDNINTISIGPQIAWPWPLSYFDELMTLSIIKEAKRQGMAVILSPHAFGPGPANPDAVSQAVLDDYANKVLYWASLAEEFGVEYFCPINEADVVMHRDKAIEWHNDILPQIREVFTGQVLARWCTWDVDDEGMETVESIKYRIQSSSDFDGVMLDIGPPYEEWQMKYFFDSSKMLEQGDPWLPSNLEDISIAARQEADKLGLLVYIGEFYYYTMIPGSYTMESGREEDNLEYLANFIDTASQYYDGLVYGGWSFPTVGIKGTPAEQLIKEKYGEI